MKLYIVFASILLQSVVSFAADPFYRPEGEIPVDVMHQIKEATAARLQPEVMVRLGWIRSAVCDASCTEGLNAIGEKDVRKIALGSKNYGEFRARIQAQDTTTVGDTTLQRQLVEGADYGFAQAAQCLLAGYKPESSESVSAFIGRSRASSQAQATSVSLITNPSPERPASVPVAFASAGARRVTFDTVMPVSGGRASVPAGAMSASPDTGRFSPERVVSSAAGSSGGFISPVPFYGSGVAEDLSYVVGAFDNVSGERLQ